MFLKVDSLFIVMANIKAFEVEWTESKSVRATFYEDSQDQIASTVIQFPIGMAIWWLEEEIANVFSKYCKGLLNDPYIKFEDIVRQAIDDWNRVKGKK